MIATIAPTNPALDTGSRPASAGRLTSRRCNIWRLFLSRCVRRTLRHWSAVSRTISLACMVQPRFFLMASPSLARCRLKLFELVSTVRFSASNWF